MFRGMAPERFVEQARSMLAHHAADGWNSRQREEYVTQVAQYARNNKDVLPLRQIAQALDDNKWLTKDEDAESYADEEMEYMLDSMNILLNEIANNPAYLSQSADDDGYSMKAEMNETLERLFNRAPKIRQGEAPKRSSVDWTPPQIHGLDNSQMLVRGNLLKSIALDSRRSKYDDDDNAGPKAGGSFSADSKDYKSGGSDYSQQQQQQQSKQPYSYGAKDDEYDEGPRGSFGGGRAESKMVEEEEEEEEEGRGRGSKFADGEDEEDGDEGYYDEDDEDDDDEDGRRVPATMSAGLMRMLGMEVTEELETDWKPPDETGMQNSGRIVQDRINILDDL